MKLFPKLSFLAATGLCALWSAPRAAAIPITIVQSLNYTSGGYSMGSATVHITGGDFLFAPFSAPGTLLSVQFDAHVAVAASVAEYNPDSRPLSWQGELSFQEQYAFMNFSPDPFVVLDFGPSATGPTVTLAPSGQSTFSATLESSYTRLFTSSSDLAQFSGGGSGINRISSSTSLHGYAYYGGTVGSATQTMRLTYTYDDGTPGVPSVPDSASSLALLTVGLVALATWRRGRGIEIAGRTA